MAREPASHYLIVEPLLSVWLAADTDPRPLVNRAVVTWCDQLRMAAQLDPTDGLTIVRACVEQVHQHLQVIRSG